MRKSVRLVPATAFLALSALAAHADTLYSNFGPGQTYDTVGGYIIGTDTFDSNNQVIAAPFVVDETATLTGATLPFGFFDAQGPVNVFIESSASGAPGAILDTLSQVGSITGTELVDFTCSTCSVLTAGTTYYVVAQEGNGAIPTGWLFSLATNGLHSVNQSGSTTGPWVSDPIPDRLPAFEVNGTSLASAATPEPSSLILLGTGLLATLGAARRRLTA